MSNENNLNLTFKPLTTETWDDFAELFGKNGACGGCWCMSFRLKRADFLTLKGEGNKLAMRKLGVSVELLKAAVDYAKRNNIETLEAYPVAPYQDKMPDAFAWTGLLSAYEKAGFKIAGQSSKSKFIVRYEFRQDP